MRDDEYWEYIWDPEQLELDLGIKPKIDDGSRFSIIQARFYFDRELTPYQWDQFCWAVSDVLDTGWPECVMSASIKSGTDQELCPEAYGESEISNSTEEKEM